MTNQRFDQQMQAYGQWKTILLNSIERYQQWLNSNDMTEAENELLIYEALESLRADRLTIAFVAEFSRGKTELINAIFFSEYDRRLLPSGAGRTTMCPTELFWDGIADKGYVRLLPIETRSNDKPIADYKLEPMHWTHIDLDLSSPANLAEAFQEIVKTRQVSLDEARALGLYSDTDAALHMKNGKLPSKIDIPMWRHALISFPHPLLKQGLVILDTPGLNALGTEPELTLSMLPNAQAVVFVLAADTGVTKSDLEMWQHNVKPLRSGHKKGLIVVLNKIDTLWDDLKAPEHISSIIKEQCERAAQTLGIETGQVYPTSAQKGLLAKIRHDEELLLASNIPVLENVLANDVLPYKQSLVREHILSSIGRLVKESHDILAARLASARQQLAELQGLSGKNNEVIELLMKKTRDEQVAYYKNVESFQANRKIIDEQSRRLADTINMASLDQLVADTRKSMADSWTTHGLKHGMKTFFNGINTRMSEVSDFADQLNRLVITIYRTFHKEHGIAEIRPPLYSLTKYKQEFQQLYQEAEAFRTSPMTTMTEQHYVIKKFFISLVSHVRNIFFKAQRDSEAWSKAVMSPLVKQIKGHKEMMEQRLENLRRINESRDTLQERIDELEKSTATILKQYIEVRSILDTLNQPLEAVEEPTQLAAVQVG
ncbi:MAG: dynamin family protein [Thiohalomonadaceae bacterium]